LFYLSRASIVSRIGKFTWTFVPLVDDKEYLADVSIIYFFLPNFLTVVDVIEKTWDFVISLTSSTLSPQNLTLIS